jgi:hypothetical protein
VSTIKGKVQPTGVAVAAFARDHLKRTAPEPEPCRLYTAREIEEVTCIKAAAIHGERRCATDAPDRSRENRPGPDRQSRMGLEPRHRKAQPRLKQHPRRHRPGITIRHHPYRLPSHQITSLDTAGMHPVRSAAGGLGSSIG